MTSRRNQVVARARRGAEIESVHTVHGVIVDSGPGEEIGFGDPQTLAYWRSAMKPFQALPLVEDGAAAAFEFGSTELALCCASHHGTALHVAPVEAMLRRLGLSEEALACGPDLPMDEVAARELLRSGKGPTRLHNNCSGKHTGMLALALHHGWPIEGYAEFEHPVQCRIREGLRRWLDVDVEKASWGRDGCGVPTPHLPICDMAGAYARLGRASRTPSSERAVVEAMTKHSHLVAGEMALSTRLMKATSGRLLAKAGAEGVFCVAAPKEGWGMAMKVSDGRKRAVGPALLEMLAWTGLASETELERLEPFRRPMLSNTQGLVVGTVTAEVCE